MERFAPGHDQEGIVGQGEAVPGQPVRFTMVNRMPQLVLMPCDNELWIESSGEPVDIGRPAIGQEDINGVMQGDFIDP